MPEENQKIAVKTDAMEILKGKFSKTISQIDSALREAKADTQRGFARNWSPEAVEERLTYIKTAFENDLQKLSKDITI